MDIYRHKIK